MVDASVATKWHLQDELNVAEALSLLNRFIEGIHGLIAPEHIRYEVANAITVAVRRARLTEELGATALARFLAVPLTTFSDDDLLTRAYQLTRLYHCAFYDALYIALAQRMGRPLITADRRFYNLVRHLPLVIWIADYEAG